MIDYLCRCSRRFCKRWQIAVFNIRARQRRLCHNVLRVVCREINYYTINYYTLY